MSYVITHLFRPPTGKTPYGGVLSTLLGAFFYLFLFACQSPLQSTIKTSSIAQHVPPPEVMKEKGFFVQAKVQRIDKHTGLISLETTVGSFLVRAEEDDLMKLHEGDEVTVYLVTDDAPVISL